MDASFAHVWGVTYQELSERFVWGSRRFNSQLLHDARLRDADHATRPCCLFELLRPAAGREHGAVLERLQRLVDLLRQVHAQERLLQPLVTAQNQVPLFVIAAAPPI
jgi:hypothetical protein